MTNINLVRDLLLRLEKIKVGESITIEDLNKEFPSLNYDDFITLIARLTLKYYVRVDGKYSYDTYSLEKYNKILGLDKDGLEAIDYIRNDKIWEKVQNYLNENGYNDFSIFTVVELSKNIVSKEFKDLL